MESMVYNIKGKNHNCTRQLPAVVLRNEASNKYTIYHYDTKTPYCAYSRLMTAARDWFNYNKNSDYYPPIKGPHHVCSDNVSDIPTMSYYSWHRKQQGKGVDSPYCGMSLYAKKWYQWMWMHPEASPDDYRPWTRNLPAKVYCYYFPGIGFYVGSTTTSKLIREKAYDSGSRMRELLDSDIYYKYFVIEENIYWESALEIEKRLIHQLASSKVDMINIMGVA